MAKDLEKCFNNTRNMHTNQQLLGMREVFRGVVANEWVAMPNERIDFSSCNKALVKDGVNLQSEYWNKRCEVLDDLKVQKKYNKINKSN